jgi:anti-sigma regulatory factor (Ser/Thr protein kinase)
VESDQDDEPYSLRRSMPATIDSVGAARHAVRSFASDLEVDVDGLALAVSEAVTNVVTHAYPDRSRGTVELRATATPSAVTLTVRDEGRGLTPDDDTPGAGLGLVIIDRLADAVELLDTAEGVVLTMRFPRGGRWSDS